MGTSTKEHVGKSVSMRALMRMEQPEDLKGAIMFLSSQESDFITGQTLVVDGGDVLY